MKGPWFAKRRHPAAPAATIKSLSPYHGGKEYTLHVEPGGTVIISWRHLASSATLREIVLQQIGVELVDLPADKREWAGYVHGLLERQAHAPALTCGEMGPLTLR